MPAADLIVFPAVVLACMLVPLYLSLHEVNRGPTGPDLRGGMTVPDRPTPGDSAPIDPEAIRVDPSSASTDRKVDAPRRPVG